MSQAHFLALVRDCLEQQAPGMVDDTAWDDLLSRCREGQRNGAREYGATGYLDRGRDHPLEAIEELRDVVNYGIFDTLQRGEVDMDVVAATVHAIVAEWYLRRARSVRLGRV